MLKLNTTNVNPIQKSPVSFGYDPFVDWDNIRKREQNKKPRVVTTTNSERQIRELEEVSPKHFSNITTKLLKKAEELEKDNQLRTAGLIRIGVAAMYDKLAYINCYGGRDREVERDFIDICKEVTSAQKEAGKKLVQESWIV